MVYKTTQDSINDTDCDVRYIVINESVSGHCCFNWSVIDRSKGISGQGILAYWAESICESMNRHHAIMVAYHLNNKEPKK